MFISNFYGFLLDEFGMLSGLAGFSATAELSCLALLDMPIDFTCVSPHYFTLFMLLLRCTMLVYCHCILCCVIGSL